MLELDRRIQAYEADPTSARPGNEVMAELAKKFSIPHIIGNKPHKRKPKYWRGRKP